MVEGTTDGEGTVAFKKFPVTLHATLKVALAGHFEPESKRHLYLVEFQSCCKKCTESWVEFGEDLKILVDKAYPMLEDDARQQLVLQCSCIMIKLPLELNRGSLKQLKQLLKQLWSWSHIWYNTVYLVQLPQ